MWQLGCGASPDAAGRRQSRRWTAAVAVPPPAAKFGQAPLLELAQLSDGLHAPMLPTVQTHRPLPCPAKQRAVLPRCRLPSISAGCSSIQEVSVRNVVAQVQLTQCCEERTFSPRRDPASHPTQLHSLYLVPLSTL